jgi:hypothetical protein
MICHLRNNKIKLAPATNRTARFTREASPPASDKAVNEPGPGGAFRWHKQNKKHYTVARYSVNEPGPGVRLDRTDSWARLAGRRWLAGQSWLESEPRLMAAHMLLFSFVVSPTSDFCWIQKGKKFFWLLLNSKRKKNLLTFDSSTSKQRKRKMELLIVAHAEETRTTAVPDDLA